MLNGLFILDVGSFRQIYAAQEVEAISALIKISGPQQTKTSILEEAHLLRDVDVILSGWGGPKMDAAFLSAAPRLKAVFYGAGSVKGVVTDAFWERGIVITSAYAANAIPVAEYTLSQILFSLKRGWYFASATRQHRKLSPRIPVPGALGSIVGLVSLGAVGRRVATLLRAFEVKVIAHDPFATKETAHDLGLTLCSLEEVFATADVVSLHTPWLKETENMIRGSHFASMKPNATFINTARGAVVCEQEMVKVLVEREDLFAVLDVTYPEPPRPDSPLFSLPNVVLTPHIAGAMGNECQRMGRCMLDELRRYLRGEPLQWAITRDRLSRMA